MAVSRPGKLSTGNMTRALTRKQLLILRNTGTECKCGLDSLNAVCCSEGKYVGN